MKKTVVVTGGSKGIGAQLVRLFASEYNVVSVSRSLPAVQVEGVEYILCDITDHSAVSEAFDAVAAKFGSIDMLVNNAGWGISGPIEYTSIDDAKKIMEINLLGCFYTTQAALKYLRASKGRIINVSSAAALFSIPYQAFYSMSKAALSSFSDSLRNETKSFGVSVLTVLPGDIATDFTSARKKSTDVGEYGAMAEKSVAIMEKDEMNGMTAEYAAKQIFKYATRRKMPLQRVIGFKYKLFAFLQKLLPHRFIQFIIYSMYGGKSK